jgi:ATP/maltotriose-dependent transcriptional regulator MalT
MVGAPPPARFPAALGMHASLDQGRDNPYVARAAADLEQGRRSFSDQSWATAYEALSRADCEASLAGDDLWMLAVAAYMLARDDDWVRSLERAHAAYLQAGESRAASRPAIWIGVTLAQRGEMGPASGWLARAEGLLADVPGEAPERGYLLFPRVFRHEAAGDYAAAADVAAEAAEIGRRTGDRELFALAAHTRGDVLIRQGQLDEGGALLDEAMVTVTAERLSPIVTGIVYCGVILTCQEAQDVRRAREWTLALSRWCERQPDLVAFTGRCLVHRAEILQLNGTWHDALEEARRGAQRLAETGNRAAGVAFYRVAELLRLTGNFAAAAAAYEEASRFGWEPQPGLAQLRLAQGKPELAVAAIRRAVAETAEPLKLAALLPACVEILLAVGEREEAAAAARRLDGVVADYDSPMLAALAAHARGSVALAGGAVHEALAALREACETWRALDIPYEVARTRLLIGHACRELGDADTAALEREAARRTFAELGAAPDLARLEVSPREAAAHGLSARELQVLRLLAGGRTNRQIAAELVISEHTAARHVQNIFAKLRVSSRSAATAFAFEHGLVD